MSQAKEREIQAINNRIDNLFEQEGSVNREFPDKPSIHDLIYDELRNLNGAIASLNTTNDIYLKALVDNTGTTAVNLKDVKHRLKEIIPLSGNVRDNTAVMSEHLESANQQLDEITTNALDTVKGVDSVDERLCEVNNLLVDIRNSEVVNQNMTQDDIDAMVQHGNQGESTMKEIKLTKEDRHILYKALGSRASTLRNQIGYTRVNNDGTIRNQITDCERLLRKIKDS